MPEGLPFGHWDFWLRRIRGTIPSVSDSKEDLTYVTVEGGWLEATVKSANQFVQFAIDLLDKTKTRYPGQIAYVFRGQPRSAWALKPTLLRALPAETDEGDSLRMESMAFDNFIAQAHLYVNPPTLPPANQTQYLVSWWALMRHHFGPTRLLDWTESPYVAAYFAVSELLDEDGAVWMVQSKHLSDAAKGKGGVLKQESDQVSYFRDVEHPQIVEPLHPTLKSDRMAVQKGLFTVSRNIIVEHSRGILNTIGQPKGRGGELLFAKLIMPGDIKRGLRRQLAYMNLTASTLFPGVDGLGRSVTEAIELFEPTAHSDAS